MNKQNNNLFAGFALAVLVFASAFILHSMGRIWICSDGTVLLWVSDAWSDQNSQHISDPYSFSHLLHGLLFFGALYKLTPKLSFLWRLNISVLLEASWEILENSSLIINRYRDAGALGYSGDTVLNSMGDLLSCALGFVLAYYLGFKKSVILFILVEIGMILTIRDSLILNVIMLIHPVEAIKTWQSVMVS
jgi:hypothetical protein